MKAKDIVGLMLDNKDRYIDGAFELVDVEFVKEGPNWYLRVYVDKENGITIDDCESISRSLEKFLDEHDPIEQPYILEVSSPGLDRPLKTAGDFEKYTGSLVDVRLYKAFEARKEFQGTLIGLSDGVVIIDEDGTELKFSQKDISSCRLSVIF